jgi:hypothetical protein
VNLIALVDSLLNGRNALYDYHFIPDPAAGALALRADQVYFRVILTRMYLENRRRLFQTQYPVVHALLRFSTAEGPMDINRVIQPVAPGQQDASQLDRVITLNLPLLPLTVYRGGDLELLIALYAAPADNWAQQFLDLAKNISELPLAGLSPLEPAIQVGQILNDSLSSALRLNRLDLQVGLNTALISNQTFRSGTIAIVDAPTTQVNSADLSIQQDRLYLSGQPFTDSDYMLLRIDVTASRDDWQNIGGLARQRRQLEEAAARWRDKGLVREQFMTFMSAVVLADLTSGDMQRIRDWARERVIDIRRQRAGSVIPDGIPLADPHPTPAEEFSLTGEPSPAGQFLITNLFDTEWLQDI